MLGMPELEKGYAKYVYFLHYVSYFRIEKSILTTRAFDLAEEP
jgi:hypothetical protein